MSPFIENAIDRIKPGRNTVLMVGTGLSIALTKQAFPQLSWLGLIRSGFEYSVEIGRLSRETADRWIDHLAGNVAIEEILHVAGFLESQLRADDDFDYKEWLRKEFGNVDIRDELLADVIKKISDAGVKICTLNYDSILESVTGLPVVRMDDHDEVIDWLNGDLKGILHLHGHWRYPNSCVLSSQNYRSATENSVRSFFQRHLTVFEGLLFIGCGGTFEDPNFKKTLDWLRGELKISSRSVFALVKDHEVQARRSDPAWKNIVEPVSFGDSNSALCEFLDGLFSGVVASGNSYPMGSPDAVEIGRLDQLQKTVSLDSINCLLPFSPQAYSVRHAQSFEAEETLRREGFLWLAADWGMEEDEFISALISRRVGRRASVYSVHITNYKDKASFYDQIGELLGSDFESFCNSISLADCPYLILRDVPLETCDDEGRLSADLLSLTEILTSFCPGVCVILVSRIAPRGVFGVVELAALDVADTRAYIESSSMYKGGLVSRDFTQIFELTNGVPKLIQELLSKLAVASLDEIVNERGGGKVSITGRFGDSIKALSNATELDRSYAYNLLQSLSAFPYGEYLENLKRVNRSKKYSIEHVVILQREGLIYVEEQEGIGDLGGRSSKKRLLVTGPARRWLSQEMKPRDILKIKKQAYQLYFGENWETMDPKLNHIFKINDIGEKSAEISNAKYFIVDIFAEGRVNQRWRLLGLELASQFCAAVSKKSYYKVVEDLYTALKLMLEEVVKDNKYWNFVYLCAQSIRMVGGEGGKAEALRMLLDCLGGINQKKLEGSIKLQIALIYSSNGSRSEAVRYALEAKKLSTGVAAMQATHIALKNGDAATKEIEISAIQEKSRSKGRVLFSNIALDRADALDDGPAKVMALRDVVEYCRKNNVLYNEIRATLRHSEAVLHINGVLDSAEMSALINIYHHLHHEDMPALHSQCHRVLWKVYCSRMDIVNLLQLFKYSSLYWRLRDQRSEELEAIKGFEAVDVKEGAQDLGSAASYYYGRLASIEG